MDLRSTSSLNQNLPGYKTSWTPAQLMWPRLSPACHPCKISLSHLQPATFIIHVDKLLFSLPLMKCTWHFHREHLRHVYFRCQGHFLLFLFNQGPSSTAAATDVKEIFRSISKNTWSYTFCNCLSAKWNANNLAQELNTGSRVHLLQR